MVAIQIKDRQTPAIPTILLFAYPTLNPVFWSIIHLVLHIDHNTALRKAGEERVEFQPGTRLKDII